IVMLLVILVFKAINDDSVVNSIFKAAGYTYGPLLGLFAFGMISKRAVKDKLVPFFCILSPLISFLIDKYSPALVGYSIGFELVVINGMIMYILLFLTSRHHTEEERKSVIY